MNKSTVAEIQRQREEALKIVQACDLLLRGATTDASKNGDTKDTKDKPRQPKGHMTAAICALLEKKPMAVGELAVQFEKQHGEFTGPQYASGLNVRLTTELRRQWERGILKRKQVQGKYVYSVAKK